MPLKLIRASFWLSCMAVFVLSLTPMAHLPPIAFEVWDKAQHALAFLLLGALGLFAYRTRVVAIVIGLLLFGALIELAQALTGWRYGEWQDWLADGLGVLAAMAVRQTLKS
jgi:VanZ family protein